MFNYESFTEKIIDKFSVLIPNDFSEQDLSYIKEKIRQYTQISGAALNKDYDDKFNDKDKAYIAEMVAKWTCQTSVNLINDNTPQDRRDTILQNIAYTVFEMSKEIIIKQMPKGKMTGEVEIIVFKVYEKCLKELQNEGVLSRNTKEDYEARLDNYYHFSKLGDEELNDNNYNEALLNYEKALDIIPNHTGVLNQAAWTLCKLGNYDKAFQYSNKAVLLLAENTGGYIYDTRGCTLLYLKKYYEALADFDKAISIDEKEAVFWEHKGDVLKEIGDINGALECLNKAIKLLPNDDIKEKLANIYNQTNEYQKSKKLLDELISDYPFDKNLYILRARNYIGLNNLNGAIIDLDRAISLDKNNAESYYIRGLCNYDAGDYKASVSDFNNAISLDADYANDEDIKECIKVSNANMHKSKDYNRIFNQEQGTPISFLQQMFIKYTPDGNMLYYSGFFSDAYLITAEDQIYNYRKFYNSILITLFLLLFFSAKFHIYKFLFKYNNINLVSVLIILIGILLINFLFNFISVKLIFKKANKIKEKIWVNNSHTMTFLKSIFIQFTGALTLTLIILLNFNKLPLNIGFTLFIATIIGFIFYIQSVLKRIYEFCLIKEKDGLKIFAYKELQNIENNNSAKIITNIEEVLPCILSFIAESNLSYSSKVNNLRNLIQKIAQYAQKQPLEDLNTEELRNEIIQNILSTYRIIK